MTAPDSRADTQVQAVLDILAPYVDLPPGMEPRRVRVPQILIDYDGQPMRPTDTTLRALAEQIVTAIRTAA